MFLKMPLSFSVSLPPSGHETSAAVLTWSLFELSRHPDVMAEVTAEVDAVLGDRIPTYEDVKALQVRGQKRRLLTRRRLLGQREAALCEFDGGWKSE